MAGVRPLHGWRLIRGPAVRCNGAACNQGYQETSAIVVREPIYETEGSIRRDRTKGNIKSETIAVSVSSYCRRHSTIFATTAPGCRIALFRGS